MGYRDSVGVSLEGQGNFVSLRMGQVLGFQVIIWHVTTPAILLPSHLRSPLHSRSRDKTAYLEIRIARMSTESGLLRKNVIFSE